jgi:plastocyanin
MKFSPPSRIVAVSSVMACILFILCTAGLLHVQALADPERSSPVEEPLDSSAPLTTYSLPLPEASASSVTEVLITSGGFEPDAVTIPLGSQVVWRNIDSEVHRIDSGLLEHRVYLPLILKNYSGGLTSAVPPGVTEQILEEWGSPDIQPGESYTQTFDTEGSFPYRCAYHPWHTGLVVVQAMPDLIVEGISTDPVDPILGQPFSLTVAIRNQGSVDAEEGFGVDWYADPALPPTSTVEGDVQWWQEGLGAGLTSELTNSYTFFTSGEHTLYAQVDRTDTIEEGEEENNVSWQHVVTVVAPDLIVQSIATDPLTPTVDVPFTVTVTIGNQGDGDALGDFRVDWYADPGSSPVSATVGSLQWWQSGLGSGLTADLESEYTFDTPGEHTLYAQVDRDDLVMEHDEGNNVLGPSTINAARPDLVIQDISTDPETPIANFPFSLTVTVANQDEGTAADTFRTDWYADPALPPTSTTPSDTFWEVTGLEPWQAQALSDTHTFLSEGEHVLYAQIDAPDTVTESDETNNLSEPLTVTVTSNVVQVCGTINQNTVWQTGMVYVVTCDTTVASGITLTIEPGTTVKFGYHCGLTMNGTLLANGTGLAPSYSQLTPIYLRQVTGMV